MKKYSKLINIKSGFTLIEMAIVLIVIGAITSAIIGGNALIENGKISSDAATLKRYHVIYEQYKDLYRAIPGDHVKAYDYWGTDCATTEAICNGNGDRGIDSTDESFLFFRHLFLAELIEDDLTGVEFDSTEQAVIGTNTPILEQNSLTLYPLKLELIDFMVRGKDFGSTSSKSGNILTMAKVKLNGGVYLPRQPSLTPKIAKKIDEKIDDGKPGTGEVLGGISGNNSSQGCSDNADLILSDLMAAEYRVADTDDTCVIGLVLESPV